MCTESTALVPWCHVLGGFSKDREETSIDSPIKQHLKILRKSWQPNSVVEGLPQGLMALSSIPALSKLVRVC